LAPTKHSRDSLLPSASRYPSDNNPGGNSPKGLICKKRTKEILKMKPLWSKALRFRKAFRQLTTAAAVLLLAAPAFAQGNSPWENAVNVLQQAFTSTIARGLSLVAIVVSGLTFAFGEGGSKRVLAGVLFGVGMAIAAVNFLAWLFP
jgi:type IV secretory pathway VirB2 component (pilin)